MSLYTTALTYEPEWEPPTDEVIRSVPVDDTFNKAVMELHTGLKSVTIKAIWRDHSGEQLSNNIQIVKVIRGGANKVPPVSSDQLAQLFTFLGQQHCNAAKLGPVTYRCYFRGNNDDLGGAFHKNKSFNLKPQEATVDTQKDEIDNDNDSDNEDDDKPSALLGRRGGPLRMSGGIESELIQIIRIQAAQSQQLQEDARSMFRQFREDQSANMHAITSAWSSIVSSAETMIDKAGTEAEYARTAVATSTQQLVKLSEDHAKSQRGEKDVLRYAMDMFTQAMQTQWSALGRDMSWERQIMYQQFEALAQDNKKENRRGWVKDFAPILLAVAGQIISKTGNKAQGDLLQSIAEDQLKNEASEKKEENEEDEEDEEAEEAEVAQKPTPPQRPRVPQRPVVDVKAEPRPSTMGVPSGTDPAKFFDAHPIASGFQLFGVMVKNKEGQLKKLRTVLGAQNYRVLQQAMKTSEDTAARTLGTKLIGGVMMAPGMQDKLKKVLDPEQLELLTDLSKMLFGNAGGFTSEKAAS